MAWAGFVALCVVIVMLFVIDMTKHYDPPDDEKTRQQPTYYDDVSVSLSRKDLWVQSIMAVGTLFLFAWTVLTLRHAEKTSAESIKQIIAANDIAAKALAIAEEGAQDLRQSNEATFNAERAWVEVRAFDIAWGDGVQDPLLGFLFENIGRTPAIMRSRTFSVFVMNRDTLPPRWTDDGFVMFVDQTTLPNQETFGVSGVMWMPPVPIIAERVLPERDAIMRGDRILYVQGTISYATFGRSFVNMYTWMYIPSLNVFTPLINNGFNFHGPDTGEDQDPPMPEVDPNGTPPRPLHSPVEEGRL